jgi:di/tripeptidase
MIVDEIKIVKRDKYENAEFLNALQESVEDMERAISCITYPNPNTKSLNKDIIDKLKSYKSDIEDMYDEILIEDEFIYKPYIEHNYYYELEFFYTRHNKGTIKISTNINYDGDTADKDCFIQELVEAGCITSNFSNHIVNINKISKAEYFVDEEGE